MSKAKHWSHFPVVAVCLAAAIALLPGCQSLGAAVNAVTTVANLNVENPVTPARVFQLRAAYDAAFLAPAVAYRELRRCAPGETFIPHACSTVDGIRRLQRVDIAAERALDRLEAFVRRNPRLNAVSLFQAAEEAVDTAQAAIAAVKGD